MTDLDPVRRAVARAPLSTVAACVFAAAMADRPDTGMALLGALNREQLQRLAWHSTCELVARLDAAASMTVPGEQHPTHTGGQAEGCNGAAARTAPRASDQGEGDQ